MGRRLITGGLPLLALAAAVVGGTAVSSNRPSSPTVAPRLLPPGQPLGDGAGSWIGATGVVEAEGRNVAIGATIPGVVTAVDVEPGQEVRRGDRLFTVDTRELEAQVAVREADLAAARLAVDVSDASVQEARANLGDRKSQFGRARSVDDPRAVSQEQVALRRFAAEAAQAQLARAEAQARQSRAAVMQSEALLAQARVAVDRATNRAPRDGTVLQVNVRPGQYAPAGELQTALVVIGGTNPLNLRVDVDEADVPRLSIGAAATFSVRGSAGERLAARFVRVEPLVVGKTNLSGAPGERVDTRVLQLVYAFETSSARPIYVGQQVDVFLPARAAVVLSDRR